MVGFSISRPTLSPCPSLLFSKPLNRSKTLHTNLHPAKPLFTKQRTSSSRRVSNPSSINPNPRRGSRYCSCFKLNHNPVVRPQSVSEKLQSLDFEFKSLPEPIDRVKRLLHYAALLPPFDESWRIEENRVRGCTAQVWLETKMDGEGLVRFRVDSDSEITKGFCSCLIWLLDGAEAEEVLSVKTDDLMAMNVGMTSRGNSRVNTWHNVLFSMQKRTRELEEERSRSMVHSLEAISSLVSNMEIQKRRGEKLWLGGTLGRSTFNAVL